MLIMLKLTDFKIQRMTFIRRDVIFQEDVFPWRRPFPKLNEDNESVTTNIFPPEVDSSEDDEKKKH